MKNIVIFGSGGHAKVILNEILNLEKEFNFLGFADSKKKVGTLIAKINNKRFKIIDLQTIKKKFYGVIGIGDNYLRHKKSLLFSKKYKNLRWGKIISKQSIVSKTSSIGSGSVILGNSFLGAGSKIKKHCIINSSSSIDHDNIFNDFSSTGPGVITGGNVKINKFSHLGIGCVVKNNIIIGENTICGGKSFINKNCRKNSIYFGVPSKFIKSRKLGSKYL